MPEDFRAVPATLRAAADEFEDAAAHWAHATKLVDAAALTDSAVGFLGVLSGVPTKYAAAQQECLDGLRRGLESVLFAATGLRQAADHYESVDAAYYEQFGYIDSRQ